MSQQKGYFQDVEPDDAEQNHTDTLSKQFQPKKFKDGNKIWNRDLESDDSHAYSYTPFKASTLNRSQTTPKPTRDTVHSGTLRPPKSNPFVYDPPSAPTTPKIGARPESAATTHTMSREQKLTWGRAPPPAHFRSASSMSHARATMPRPNEFTPIAIPPQRYPSFNTLPRGEPIDTMRQMPFYPPQMISRPPSVVASLPPMASNLPTFVPPMIESGLATNILNWNRISVLCCMQVIICLSIFGIGAARIMFGSLWAVGLEIIFATCAIFPALVGIYAVRTNSYSAVMFCFAANALQLIFATIPFTIGLFPAIPVLFPKIDSQWLLSENEPIHLDLILSFLVAIQSLFALHLAILGCRVIGITIRTVDEVKLQINVKAAFEEASDNILPYKTA